MQHSLVFSLETATAFFSICCILFFKFRYQKKCDELSIFSKEIEDKYNQLVQDRKDIVEFLKKSLEERKNDINDLQDKLSGQHQVTHKYFSFQSSLKKEFLQVLDM